MFVHLPLDVPISRAKLWFLRGELDGRHLYNYLQACFLELLTERSGWVNSVTLNLAAVERRGRRMNGEAWCHPAALMTELYLVAFDNPPPPLPVFAFRSSESLSVASLVASPAAFFSSISSIDLGSQLSG